MKASLLLIVSLAVQGCAVMELVVRRSSLDWDKLGLQAVAVVSVPPPVPVKMITSNAASQSPAIAPPDLAAATRDATELLIFALRQSAVYVQPEKLGKPHLEVTVKEISLTGDNESSVPASPSEGIPSIRSEMGYPRQSESQVKATVFVRLVDPSSSRPLWFKEAIGVVEMVSPRTFGPQTTDLFPPPRTADGGPSLAYLEEIAVRRALKQVVDEMLPRYEYQEVH